MRSHWLTAASFERLQHVLAAVNTLSIHAKLKLAGVADPIPPTEVEQARQDLLEFLNRLNRAITQVRPGDPGNVISVDPRLGEFALQIRSSGSNGVQSQLTETGLNAISSLLESERPEDVEHLIAELQNLRKALETQMEEDAAVILGGF